MEYRLSDLAVDGRGTYGIAASAVDYDPRKPTYLRITDINDDGTINFEGLKSVDDENSFKYVLKENDIVFARTGASTGRSYFYQKEDGVFVYAGFLIKFSLDPQKVNPRYLKYYTHSKIYYDWVHSFDSGATRGNINAKTFGEMLINLPERKIQDKIVSVMKDLDDKIAVNRRICANLEAQAQALFKHWFIDFAPFKDGKFVESELGMIPEGWRVGSPYEYLDFIYGAPYKSNLFNDKKEGLPLIRIRDLKDCSPQFYTTELLPKSEYVKAGDILAGMDAEFAPYIWKGQQGLLNQRVCKIKPKSKEIGRFFCMLLVKPQLLFVQAVKTGTTVSHIGKSDIDRFKVILPPLNEVIRFSKLGEEILDEIITVSDESSRLSSLRDTLLPKLMSGEIKV